MSTGAIVALVLGCVVLILLLLYFFLRWYTWKKVQRINPTIPRVKVDPKEYSGVWYEIARYPQIYEQGCTDVSAEYQLTPDNNLSVVNRCYKNGYYNEIEGTAHPTDHDGVFGVEFFPGIYGQYMVTYRDKDTSIVTDASRDSLWILSRKPSLTSSKQQKLITWLRKHKFDTKAMQFTPQCRQRKGQCFSKKKKSKKI